MRLHPVHHMTEGVDIIAGGSKDDAVFSWVKKLWWILVDASMAAEVHWALAFIQISVCLDNIASIVGPPEMGDTLETVGDCTKSEKNWHHQVLWSWRALSTLWW
jgi:hypothetical protein